MARLRLCSKKSKIFDKNCLKNPPKICKYSPTPKFVKILVKIQKLLFFSEKCLIRACNDYLDLCQDYLHNLKNQNL